MQAPRRHRSVVPARQRRCAPDSRPRCTQATWVGLASSGFILLPAGRDVVAMETPILPGDEELIAATMKAFATAKDDPKTRFSTSKSRQR